MAAGIRVAVITVSDRCARGDAEDLSGPALVELAQQIGAEVVLSEVVPDDLEPLSTLLRDVADNHNVNLILTTGGTGFSPRDNTPEATRAVIEREAPGMAEAMRQQTLSKTPMAMISRGVCGIRRATLIVNLPGSPKGVRESFAVIQPVLGHAIALLEGNPHSGA
jgi:molybdenum cofactor synthesis domain-containing protein